MGTQKEKEKEKEKENALQPAAGKHGKATYGKIVLTLQNCLLPEEKLNSTPSYSDGLDTETEIDLRILGCELIQIAGILLKLPQASFVDERIIV